VSNSGASPDREKRRKSVRERERERERAWESCVRGGGGERVEREGVWSAKSGSKGEGVMKGSVQ